MSKTDRFYFKGIWYPFSLVRSVACRVTGVDEELFQAADELNQLVSAIVLEDPTIYAEFITSLNKGFYG